MSTDSVSGTRSRLYPDLIDELVDRFSTTRDPVLRAQAITELLPFVDRLARRYDHRGEAHEDLVQAGLIGAVKAIDRYDPARGVAFSHYAAKTVRGELKRHFRDRAWSIRPPRRVQETHLQLSSALGELTQRLKRSPTIQELATEIGTTQEIVLQALEAGHGYRALSLDAPGYDGDPVESTLGCLDESFDRIDIEMSLRAPLASLSEHEQLIVRLRFEDSLTQAQIAAATGTSQMHVSRVLSRCLVRLRRQLGESLE